jgi:hypothetical protein
LVRIIEGLCFAIAARGAGGVITTPLLLLLWGRLRRMAVRVTKAAARIAAGTPAAPRRRPAKPRPPRPQPLRLPGGFAWLVPLVPGAAAYGSQLQLLLADPQMAPLATVPSVRRMLNPLCQMLGVPARPCRPPPRRERAGRQAADAPPAPATGNAGSGVPPAANAHAAPRPPTRRADCPASHDPPTPAPARHRCPP